MADNDRKRQFNAAPEDEFEAKRPKESRKVEFPIPENFVGLVIGRNGQEIASIARQTGCRMQVSTDKSVPGIRMVEIEGFQDAIELAKVLITVLISRKKEEPPSGAPDSPKLEQSNSNADGKVLVHMEIPADKCGAIIGKGGENMKRLRKSTNCHIVLQQTSSGVTSQPKLLQIRGTAEGVERAQRMVHEIIAVTDASSLPANSHFNTTTVHVKVPRAAVGAVMGKKGANIRATSDECNVKIQFLPEDDPFMLERTLAIIGTPLNVTWAMQKVKTVIETNQKAGELEHLTVFYLDIPASKCGIVIGRGGETIKQINTESGAYCELSREPHQNPLAKTVVIRGTELQVEHAKHLICVKVGDIPPNTPFNPPPNVDPVQRWFQNQIAPAMSFPAAEQQLQTPAEPSSSWPTPSPDEPKTPNWGPKQSSAAPTTDYSSQWLQYYMSVGDTSAAEAVRHRIEEQTRASEEEGER
ncbi:unnamed protein product [Caenorhabditis sp. 36 PRJEB53466]|nr:unnamed protein product [Caenorhabditis sp. 36 PRJEB53466]